MSSRLSIVSKALEDALRSFSIEIAKVAGGSYEFRAVIEKSSYQDGAVLAFYAKRDYETPVKGGSAEATWHELCRRADWNETHQPMLQLSISSPVASVSVDANDDMERFDYTPF